jgi:hypothetical protein
MNRHFCTTTVAFVGMIAATSAAAQSSVTLYGLVDQPAVANITGQTASANNHQIAIRLGIKHTF